MLPIIPDEATVGSGLAVGRTLMAVLENYQQADGTGGVRQKVLGNGKVDANTLHVVKLAAPLY